MTDDFFIRLERQLEAAELRELKRAPALRRIANPRRLLSMPLAAAVAVGVVVVVLASMGTLDRNDVERQAQRRAEPLGYEIDAPHHPMDVGRGVTAEAAIHLDHARPL